MSEYQPTPKQEQAIREYLHEAVVPLIEDVLVKKLGQAMAYLKEQQRPEQEPVAYYYESPPGKRGVSLYKETEEWQPLYTAPPKREWVGLTDEEMEDLWDRYAHMEMMRAIEAKLKEKNGG